MFVPGGPLTLLGIEYLVEPTARAPEPARPRGPLMRWLAGLLTTLVLVTAAAAAHAESSRIRIAEQFGVGFLPLHVIRDQKLIERFGKERGLEIEVVWAKLSGGAALNEALLADTIDIASGGLAPLLTIWDRTRGSVDVKGVTALVSLPYYLTSRNPDVKTIADFTEKDRIALPSVTVSIQARILQMAAEQAFGPGQFKRLDALTVALPHPEATAAMLGGGTEVTAHFTSPPFQEQQLRDPKIHKVLSSYDVLGGPATAIVLWAKAAFRDDNPGTYAAFLDALAEAVRIIEADKAEAARTYVRVEGSKLDPAFVQSIIESPEITYALTPSHTGKLADFMYRVGAIKNQPKDWRDYFFDNVHDKAGS